MILVSPRASDIAAKFGVRRVVPAGMAVMGIGLVLLSFFTPTTPYWYIAVCLVIMAAGVGSALPSLSSGIVQSVPMHKAGVGSAVNDTTREVGGAIGIAVLGSIVTSIYRSHLAPTLKLLPTQIADVARDNVAKALGVAQAAAQRPEVGPEKAGVLATAVRQSFVDGAQVGLRVAAGLVAVAAGVVAVRLSGPETAGEAALAASFRGPTE
jgi:MFS family permease